MTDTNKHIVTLPNKREFFDDTVPESWGFDDRMPQASDWEKQEILAHFDRADRDLREAIDRLASELDQLHRDGVISSTGVGNAMQKATMATASAASLVASRSGLSHRLALAEREQEA